MLAAVALTVTAAIASFIMGVDYLPAAALCGNEPTPGCVDGGAGWAATARSIAVALAVVMALLTAAVGVVLTVRTRRGRVVAATVGALLSASAGLISVVTGSRFQWDQLALRSVRVVGPGDYRGMVWMFQSRADDVRFVMVDGVELTVDALRRTAMLSAGSAVGAFVLLIGALLLLRPTPGGTPSG